MRTYRSKNVWTSWLLKMGPIDCPETSVQNYHSTLRNILEQPRSHQHRGGSLKPRNKRKNLVYKLTSYNCSVSLFVTLRCIQNIRLWHCVKYADIHTRNKDSGCVHESSQIEIGNRFMVQATRWIKKKSTLNYKHSWWHKKIVCEVRDMIQETEPSALGGRRDKTT